MQGYVIIRGGFTVQGRIVAWKRQAPMHWARWRPPAASWVTGPQAWCSVMWNCSGVFSRFTGFGVPPEHQEGDNATLLGETCLL